MTVRGQTPVASAEVRIYESADASAIPIAKGSTDAEGRFDIDVPAQGQLVYLRLVPGAASRHLDFTRISGGPSSNPATFAVLADAVSTDYVLTSAVPRLSQSTTVNINPFTHLVTHMALSVGRGKLIREDLQAAILAMQAVLGFDPASLRRISAQSLSDGDLGAAELTLLLLQAGIQSERLIAQPTCYLDPSGYGCWLQQIVNRYSQVEYRLGVYYFQNGNDLVIMLKALVSAGRQLVTHQVLQPRYSAITPRFQPISSISAQEATQAFGLNSFVSNFRLSLQAASTRFNALWSPLRNRVGQMTFEGLGDGLGLIESTLRHCDFSGTTVTCKLRNEAPDSLFTSGIDGVYAIMAIDDGTGYQFSGDAVFSKTVDTHLVRLILSKKSLQDLRHLEDIRIDLEVQDTGNSSGHATFSLSIRAHDQAASLQDRPCLPGPDNPCDDAAARSRWVDVVLAPSTLTYSSISGVDQIVGAISARLETAEGDRIEGTVNDIQIKEVRRPNSTKRRAVLERAVFDASLADQSGTLAELRLLWHRDLQVYNPLLPISPSNPESGTVAIRLITPDEVQFDLVLTALSYYSQPISLKITEGKRWVLFEGRRVRTLQNPQATWASTLDVSSSDVFRARLSQTSGAVSGEIYQGDNLIGIIDGGRILIGNVEVSLW